MQDSGNSPHIDPRATFSRSDTASSGDWNASTNSPGLTDGSGTANQYYRVSVAGTQDLGSGSITYAVGDYVKYSGSVWYKTTQPIGVTYWSNEKHLSSENLLFYSNPNDAAWTEQGSSITLDQAASPDGTTTASLLTEDSSTGVHRGYRSIAGNSVSGQTYTFVGYFKANGRTLVSAQFNGSGITTARVEFDLSSSGTATSRAGSPANLSISQIGSTGWYKCSFQATATGAATMYLNVYLQDGADSTSYTGDGTSGVYAWGCNVSTTGQLVHEDTSGQIYREYAPSLKYVTPATGGMARFEYDPATDGQSEGILIEGQSTNLFNYSEEFDNAYWSKYNTPVTANAGVAPSGQLVADLLVAASTGSSTNHYLAKAISFSSGTTYTLSVYVKAAGYTKFNIRAGNPAVWGVSTTFTLTGSGSASVTSGYGAIEACGNGWFRCSVTETAASTSATNILLGLVDNSGNLSFDGDDYSGVLLWGAQLEQASFASSYLKVEGSTATRAADSLSVVSTDLFDNGGGSLVVETENVGRAYYAAVLEDDSTSVYQDYVALTVRADNKARQTVNAPGSTGASDEFSAASTVGGSYFKIASRFAPNDFGVCIDGGTVSTDTTGAVPSNIDKLFIGWYDDGGRANAHIKRVAVYNEPLSDTNLQALTS